MNGVIPWESVLGVRVKDANTESTSGAWQSFETLRDSMVNSVQHILGTAVILTNVRLWVPAGCEQQVLAAVMFSKLH